MFSPEKCWWDIFDEQNFCMTKYKLHKTPHCLHRGWRVPLPIATCTWKWELWFDGFFFLLSFFSIGSVNWHVISTLWLAKYREGAENPQRLHFQPKVHYMVHLNTFRGWLTLGRQLWCSHSPCFEHVLYFLTAFEGNILHVGLRVLVLSIKRAHKDFKTDAPEILMFYRFCKLTFN